MLSLTIDTECIDKKGSELLLWLANKNTPPEQNKID